MQAKKSRYPGPIFVFAIHRSGSTALSRILNCHPDVTIWGEHGGFINQLAEIDSVMRYTSQLRVSLENRHLEDYIAATDRSVTRFDPWCSPVTRESFQTWSRDYIRTMFANMLPAKHRWGFKEIRYHTPRTARFLSGLFPAAQFILLSRKTTNLCVSNLFVKWSLERLAGDGALNSESEIRAAVEDCVYAIKAIEHDFGQIEAQLSDRVLAVSYDDIVADRDGLVDRLFDFLALEPSAALRAKIAGALAVRSGATATDVTRGIFSNDLVQSLIPEAISKAEAALADGGPDLGRLKRLKDTGRYSYLLGDHALHDTTLSTMF